MCKTSNANNTIKQTVSLGKKETLFIVALGLLILYNTLINN
ncbi:hypothetical protein CRENPOLYSF2_160010 [Crenothrix polyspora]|uniref:Uncharacterized protein n=1 Tax=Crenothrix polyspora TaxID=360316 RepID=A0A1R4H2Q0_9GAMM|nr:hypothetical protein CRENPOLYSF2_160010 [Crenothrix polyspora]